MKTIKRILFTITVLVLFGSSALAIPTNATFHTSEPEPSPALTPDNVNDWKLLYSLGTKRVYDYALNPTKPELVYSNEDGVFFYDFVNKTSTPFTEYLPRPADPSWKSYNVAFSPNGRYLAIGESRIYIFDLFNNNKTIIIIIANLHNEYNMGSLEFSPDGNHLLVKNYGGSSECDGVDMIYSLVDLMLDSEPNSTESSPIKETSFPQLHYKIIYDRRLCFQSLLAYHLFSDDGNLILVGINGFNSELHYEAVSIDINTGQELAKYTVNQVESWTHLFSVSQDLSYVIEASYAYPSSPPVELKDFKTGELIQTFPDRIYHLNQTDYILSSKSSSPGFPREFKILDRALEEICTFKTQPSLSLEIYRPRIRITNGKLVAYTLGSQSIGVWDISSCELLWEFPLLSFSSIKNPISATGEVFYNDAWPYLDVIKLDTGERNFRLSSSTGESFIGNQEDSFAYEDVKNNLLYIKAGDKTFDIFDLESGKWLKSVSISADQDLYEVFITHDFSNMVYRTGFSSRFYYWDITNQEKLPLRSTPSGRIFQFSTNFEKIAFKTKEYLTICPFKTLENCKRIDIPTGYLPAVFSGKFDKLLFKRNRHEQALSDDESELDLRLINVKTNSFLTLEATPKLYNEEDAFYVTFAFSPTEDLLVALYNDPNNHELHIWNSKTGAPLGSFNVPISARELWFTPDGSKIVVLAGGILYIIGVPCTFP